MFNQLPIITRCWFGATFAETIGVNLGMINPFHVFWQWELVKSKMQLYRFLTPFLYAGPPTFNTLMTLFMILQFSKQYESGGCFNTGAGGGTADYAFCLLLGAIGHIASYMLFSGLFPLQPVFCTSLLFYVLYIWSKRNPTNNSNIWGFPILGMYLPFAYLALTVLIGGDHFSMLNGMFLGHLYYFAVDVVPGVYGKDFLQTPIFLINYFGVGEYQAAPAAVAPAAQRRGGGHEWGSGGQRLGTN